MKEFNFKNKEDYINLIRENLTPDLLKPQFRKDPPNKMWGHCYVASEAFYHIAGSKDSKYFPMRIKINDINHWFLKDNEGNIVDITYDQFDFKVDYNKAVKAAFLTKDPSKRAKILIGRVLKYE